ncbi:MAG TPA: GTP-binding protein [Thioploca sp.]|nr:MAG: GTP-binding protein [Gammaproteobacteria bacterium]HDN27697.1 GTP-binding protein [Thioploca sp.]
MNYKLIFTGPSGAGKTTAISVLSDTPVILTEAKATKRDPSHKNKKSITVGLDYGIIKLKNKDKIYLYGTPGQERFDFMWDIITEGGLGLVLLVDNARTDPFEDMRFFLKAFGDFIQKTKVVIGITRMDISPTPRIADYHQELRSTKLNPPVFNVDARSKKDVSLLLQALLYSLEPSLNEK